MKKRHLVFSFCASVNTYKHSFIHLFQFFRINLYYRQYVCSRIILFDNSYNIFTLPLLIIIGNIVGLYKTLLLLITWNVPLLDKDLPTLPPLVPLIKKYVLKIKSKLHVRSSIGQNKLGNDEAPVSQEYLMREHFAKSRTQSGLSANYFVIQDYAL